MKSVLITEDNAEMQILLESALSEFELVFATTLREARLKLAAQSFDLLILDLNLPDGDGFQLLSEMGAHPIQREMPVIVLTGKNETATKVFAFSIGAEDFVCKPFDPLELKARVAAKLKKAERQGESVQNLRVGDLNIDISKQKVWIKADGGEQPVDLTSLELRLLLTISRTPLKVFSREFLLQEVWGSGLSVTDRTVDTHIGHLRKKLSGSASKIDTVIGAGYRFLTPT